MLWLCLSLILAVALAYNRAGLRTTTAAFAALLLAFGVFGGSLAWFGLLLLAYAAAFVPLSLPTLRQEWLTRPALDAMQRRLRPMLAADVAADIDGGDWDRRLLGESAAPLPAASAADAAPMALLSALTASLDRSPRDSLPALVEQRALAASLPALQGGLELSAAQRAQLLQGLGFLAPQSPLPDWLARADAAAQIVLRHTTAAQQTALLPAIADGSLRPALATRSYWATGDSLPDHAVVCRGLWKGKEITGLLASFDKITEADAELATELLISLQLRDPEDLLGPTSTDGPVLVRVPAALADAEAQPSGTLRVQGRDRFVPLDHLVGGPTAIGQVDAPLQTAATAVAMGFVAATSGRAARRFERLRLRHRVVAFHRLRAPPAVLQQALAQAALDAFGLDSLRRLLARQLNHPPASPRIASLAQALACSLDTRCDDASALDERALHTLIGALCPVLRQSLQAASTTPHGLALLKFDETLWPLVGEVVAHQSQAFLLALSDGRLAGNAAGGGRHAQRLARYRAAVACCCDAHVLGAHPDGAGDRGGAALRDALAQTLGLAAALQAHAEDGWPRDQAPLLDAYAARCGRRIEAALAAFARQQTSLRRRLWLRVLLLPLGELMPSADADAVGLAALLQNAVRERLQPALIAEDASLDAGNQLEHALAAAADAQQRLLQALDNGRITPAPPLAQIGDALNLNVITAAEADGLRTALNLSEDWLRAADADQNVHFTRRP